MKPKQLTLTILILLSIILSSCGTAPTQPAVLSTASPPAKPPASLPAEPTASLPATPTAIPTSMPSATPTAGQPSTPAPGTIQVSPADDMQMVYVPAGDFSMGSTAGPADEQPVHNVSLDAYWIDRTEVTNIMYHTCVNEGPCLRPMVIHSNTHSGYYFDLQYSNYPVIALLWSSAETYCAWAGRRLPTEAEWEKAARGTDGRTYPWGNEFPNAGLLNFNRPAGDTTAVDDFKFGASPYGALNMAGNVTEWVADWYAADYYAASPATNPTGPALGDYKVMRGGSWHSDEYSVRSADRHWIAPDTRDIVIGFRCAMSAP